MADLNLDIAASEAPDSASGAMAYRPPDNLRADMSEQPDAATAAASYRAPLGLSIHASETPDGAQATAQGPLAGTYRPIVRVDLVRPSMRTSSRPVGYESGLGTPFALDGSGLTGRFHDDVPDSTSWTVDCLARPAADLGQVLAALDAIGEDAMAGLFGDAPAEPYRTWKALWYSAAPLPYRLGAVLLALAARTDELRKGR